MIVADDRSAAAFEAGPDEHALRGALRETDPQTPVVVDFDETLWLRNSTEEYLDGLRPRFLGYLILLALDVLRPWLLLRGPDRRHVYRDWIRVMVATVLMPWNLALWRRRAPELAARWRNAPLMEALDQGGSRRILVATFGIDLLVAPLLKAMAPRYELAVAGTLFSGWRVRRMGKRAALESRIGAADLARSVAVTDHESDHDLLKACGTPFLIRWPDARYRPAFSDAYVPFLYTQKGKRSGLNYMVNSVLLEDVLLVSLAIAWFMTNPLAGVVGILFLHLSFWAIYEIGYAENDIHAIKYEENPKIWPGAAELAARVKPVWAWFTAVLLAIPGVAILVWTNVDMLRFVHDDENLGRAFALFLGLWTAYLAASRFAFWLYNRMDVDSRSYLYSVLQMFRVVGYGLFFYTVLTGALLLVAVVLTRWIPYLTYRQIGKRWTESHRFLLLMFFSLLAVGGAVTKGFTFFDLHFVAIVSWLTVSSYRRLPAVLRKVRFFGAVQPKGAVEPKGA
jgi:hypothetical protein